MHMNQSKEDVIQDALHSRDPITEILSSVYDAGFKAGRGFGKARHRTPVMCYNRTRQPLIAFTSIQEASTAMNYKSRDTIPDAIKAKRLTRKGHYWEYIT